MRQRSLGPNEASENTQARLVRFRNIVSRIFIVKPVKIRMKYSTLGLLLSAIFMVFIRQTMPLSLLSLGLGTWSIVFFGGFIFPIFVGYNLARYRNMASTSNALLFSGIWVACSASTITAHSFPIVRFMQIILVPSAHFPPYPFSPSYTSP